MLVLKRRPGESIIVNEQMRIVVVGTGEGACKLAFDSPPSNIIRGEEVPRPVESVLQSTALAMRVPR